MSMPGKWLPAEIIREKPRRVFLQGTKHEVAFACRVVGESHLPRLDSRTPKEEHTMHGSFRSVPIALVVAALVWATVAPKAMAQYPTPRPQPCKVYPPAPDMRGPGYYVANQCVAPHGPCYNVTPPFPPFNGMVGPVPPGQACFGQMSMAGLQGQGIPFHRFVRSPRDFYMQDGVTGGPCK